MSQLASAHEKQVSRLFVNASAFGLADSASLVRLKSSLIARTLLQGRGHDARRPSIYPGNVMHHRVSRVCLSPSINRRGGSTSVFAMTVITIACAGQVGHSQWGPVSQRDLCGFTEKAIWNTLVAVSPPVITRQWESRWSRVLVIDFGDYSPKEFVDDPFVAAALEVQFRVSIIRIYRNKPAWRRYWAPTLAAVEQKIQQMLNVAAAPWTYEQKNWMIGHLEDEINVIYMRHFERWANDEGLTAGAKRHTRSPRIFTKSVSKPSRPLRFPTCRPGLGSCTFF